MEFGINLRDIWHKKVSQIKVNEFKDFRITSLRNIINELTQNIRGSTLARRNEDFLSQQKENVDQLLKIFPLTCSKADLKINNKM